MRQTKSTPPLPKKVFSYTCIKVEAALYFLAFTQKLCYFSEVFLSDINNWKCCLHIITFCILIFFLSVVSRSSKKVWTGFFFFLILINSIWCSGGSGDVSVMSKNQRWHLLPSEFNHVMFKNDIHAAVCLQSALIKLQPELHQRVLCLFVRRMLWHCSCVCVVLIMFKCQDELLPSQLWWSNQFNLRKMTRRNVTWQKTCELVRPEFHISCSLIHTFSISTESWQHGRVLNIKYIYV